MIKVQIQMEIEVPPETVFDLLADYTKHPIWDPHVTNTVLYTEGPIKNGSRGINVGISRGRMLTRNFYYDAYDRPKWVSVRTTSGSLKSKITCEFIRTEMGTKIRWLFEAKFSGFMRLFEPFLKSTLIKQRKENLEALSDYISKNRKTMLFT
jgi:carbon monoxide dehydrogenase subunit G